MPQNEHLLLRNNGNHCEYFAEFFWNGIPFETLVSVGKKWQQESAPFTVYNFVHAKESLKQNISIHKNALKTVFLQTKCLHQINFLLSLSKALVAIIVSSKSLPPPLNKWGDRFGKLSCRRMPRNFFSSSQFQRKWKLAWSSFNL